MQSIENFSKVDREKNIYPLFLIKVLFLFWLTNFSFAQEIIFNENFDSYQTGGQLACQNPTDWTTLNYSPCDFITDPIITDTFANSGNNSVAIVLNCDPVKPLPDYNTGIYRISFYNYIPHTKSGYFCTLSHFEGNLSNWGMEVWFNYAELGVVNAGGYNAANFYFNYDEWVLNEVVINLDADSAKYFYNGDLICQWKWTLGFNGTGVPKILAGNDFWGASPSDEMYIDDYKVEELFIPVELVSFTYNIIETGIELKWITETEMNNKGFEVQRSAVRDQISEWEKIGFVEGNGTTTLRHQYSFTDKNHQPRKYIYRLKQIDFDGSYNYSKEIEVDASPELKYSLEQNFPNPFNPMTTIKYSLPKDENVKIIVLNSLGQQVAELVNNEVKAGNYEIRFSAEGKNALASGVYFYQINAGDFVRMRKMILLK